MVVELIAVFECSAGEYGETNAEDLSYRGVDMGWIAAFLNKIMVDLFWSQVNIELILIILRLLQ